MSYPSPSPPPSTSRALSPPHSLDHNSLNPPSLAAMQAQHQADNMVLRSLYPGASSSGNHTAFANLESPVYRSVTIDAAANNNNPGAFDPLSQFDRGYPQQASGYGYGQPSLKDLSLNPKQPQSFQVTQQADYKPTLKHLQQPSYLETKFVQPKLSAVVSPIPAAAAATTAAPVASLQSPPPAPLWLEPNSHFFCSCPPPTTAALLFDTVQSTLQSLHENNESAASICTLDCTPTPARFKLNCTAYATRSGAATPFVVRIYCADAAKHKYCVEFQRRRGDVCHFYELFRTARTRIQAAHPLLEDETDSSVPALQKAGSLDSLNFGSLDINLPQPLLRSWSAPSLPAESGSAGDRSFSKDHMCETVRSLLQMCASPCIDIKLNGVLALAELSCSPAFNASTLQSKCGFNLHETLVAEGCFQLFLDCLPIAQLDIHRASLTALANLSETHAHLCSQVLADERSMRCIYDLAASSTNQVVRECARLMNNCATKLGSDLLHTLPHAHKPKFQECVQKLMQHQDAHCRKHAEDISSKIEQQQKLQQPTLHAQ